jgi:hypothetical protein
VAHTFDRGFRVIVHSFMINRSKRNIKALVVRRCWKWSLGENASKKREGAWEGSFGLLNIMALMAMITDPNLLLVAHSFLCRDRDFQYYELSLFGVCVRVQRSQIPSGSR